MIRARAAAGFTLIELMLYVGIVATLLLGVTFFSLLLLSARVKNQTVAEVEQQGAQVMRTITQLVRNAASITTPAVGASGATLSLATYDTAKNPTVLSVQSGRVRITEAGAVAVPLTNGRVSVSGFTVQNVSRSGSPGNVRIQFTVTAVNPSGRQEYTFQKTFVGSASLRAP